MYVFIYVYIYWNWELFNHVCGNYCGWDGWLKLVCAHPVVLVIGTETLPVPKAMMSFSLDSDWDISHCLVSLKSGNASWNYQHKLWNYQQSAKFFPSTPAQKCLKFETWGRKATVSTTERISKDIKGSFPLSPQRWNWILLHIEIRSRYWRRHLVGISPHMIPAMFRNDQKGEGSKQSSQEDAYRC